MRRNDQACGVAPDTTTAPTPAQSQTVHTTKPSPKSRPACAAVQLLHTTILPLVLDWYIDYHTTVHFARRHVAPLRRPCTIHPCA